MKNTIILILFLLYSLSSRSQHTNELWGIWNNSSLSDSVRIHMLWMESEELVTGNPDSLNALADTIFKHSGKPGTERIQAYALFIKGEYYSTKFELDTAQRYYFSSLKILEEFDLKADMPVLYDRIGGLYLDQHDYPASYRYFEKGMKVSEELQDHNGIALGNKNLGVNYYYIGDFDRSLYHFQRAMDLYEEAGNEKDAADMTTRLGAIYYHQGHYTRAIEYMNRYFLFDKESKNLQKHAEVYTLLGAIFFQLKDYTKAKEYYEKGLAIDEELQTRRGRAIGYYNLGECYMVLDDFDIAMQYFQKCLDLSHEFNERDLVADCYLAMGKVHLHKKEYPEAMDYYRQSLKVAEEVGYNVIVSSIYIAQGDLFNTLSDYSRARNSCEEGLRLSLESGDIQQQIGACECLYISHKRLGNPAKALEYHETFLMLTDSLQNKESIRQLQKMEFDQRILADSLKAEEEKFLAEVASQREISRQRSRKNIYLFFGVGIFITSIGLYSRLTFIRKSRAIIQQEKDRSESLLLNILPAEVAEELKTNGESIARNFEDVTVLFTDFKGFTNIAEHLNAQELVAELNTCFKAFDQIITAHRIEKIKTIGDAYLAAGGMYATKRSSVKDVVLAGLEMQTFMESRKKELEEKGQPYFEMRAGVHTGPVVAGIVGVKKFQYDIWGDTVNIASRMESCSEIGKVNISQTTYQQIRDDADFIFESRGKIHAKNKGELDMYFVSLKVSEAIPDTRLAHH